MFIYSYSTWLIFREINPKNKLILTEISHVEHEYTNILSQPN